MKPSKELIATAILAIGLSTGLVAVSFGLFSEPLPAAKLTLLDAFSQKGGIGPNSSGGNFEPFDNVSICAYLTQGGTSLTNHTVTFLIQAPYSNQTVGTAVTDSLGLAETTIPLLPLEGHDVGTWNVLAEATVDNQNLVDAVNFECEALNTRLDVSFESNGVSGISFLPSNLLSVEAHLSYRDASIAGTPVTFDIKTPNNTEYEQQTGVTNDLGRANVTYQIPWPSNLSLGVWQASASCEIFGQHLNSTANCEVYLQPQTLDVFTQKGGVGPNVPSPNFATNETVRLNAETRDALNNTVPGLTITFEIRGPGGKDIAILTNKTDSTGIANTSFTIGYDPSFIGTYVIYATTPFDNTALLDAVTFNVNG